jgi:hypothetical protein
MYNTLLSLNNLTIECTDKTISITPQKLISLFFASQTIQAYVMDNNTMAGLSIPCEADVLDTFIQLLLKCEVATPDSRYLTTFFKTHPPIQLINKYLEVVFLYDYLCVPSGKTKFHQNFEIGLAGIIRRCLIIISTNNITYDKISHFCDKYDQSNIYFKQFYDVVYKQYFDEQFKANIDNLIKEYVAKMTLTNPYLTEAQITNLKTNYVNKLLKK